MEARIDEADALLRRAAQGDAAALEQVARSWYAHMRRWARIEVGDRALAEDAVQEALVRMIRHIDRYDPSRPFAPWLRTIVRNCCRSAGAQQARHAHTALAEHHLSVLPRAEQRIDARSAQDRALALFDQLTPREREVLQLCTADGMSAAEAARALGIAPATARVLLHRARKTLRAALREDR